jgi:hypothetical protein
MNALKRICLATVLALATVSILPAKGLADYNVGDVATRDIATPVALDVVNPAATTALRSTEALKIPAIFRSLSNTNTMSVAFLDAFETTHSNFLAALQDSFHQAQLDETAIASPDFGYLVTAFNIKNRAFPLPDDLAADWARGKPGLALENKLLITLQRLMQNRVRPDELPQGLAIGDTIRVISASDSNGNDAINDIAQNGEIVPASSLVPLASLKLMFRREFPGDQQPLARAVSDFLTANCLPDHELTVIIRDRAVNQLIVSQHFTPGQVIVHRGAKIDAQNKIALFQLNDKLAADPALQAAELAMIAPAPGTPVPAAQPQAAAIPPAPAPAVVDDPTAVAAPMPKEANVLPWLIVGILATVSIIAGAVCLTILLRRRKSSPQKTAVTTRVLAPVAKVSPVTLVAPAAPGMGQNEIAPLVQAVKEAFIQELANQRRELIFAQQQAAAEIAGLVRRLDDLQAPLQQRLRTYESEIRRLEKELAERTEENVELLKLKIQMTQDQMATEAIHNRTSATSKSTVEGLFN